MKVKPSTPRRTIAAISNRMEQSLNQTRAGKVVRLLSSLTKISGALSDLTGQNSPLSTFTIEAGIAIEKEMGFYNSIGLWQLADSPRSAELTETVEEAEEEERELNEALKKISDYLAVDYSPKEKPLYVGSAQVAIKGSR